jgi:hypothetical protein
MKPTPTRNKRGRPSAAERQRARTLRAEGTSVETIAQRLARDPQAVASWTAEQAKAAASAAASGLPPPPASSSTAPPGAAPGATAQPVKTVPIDGGQLTAEAVVGTFEVIRSIVLEGACLSAKVDSADPRIASKLELPQRHRDLLTFCAPVLVPAFSRWLQNETAALSIAGGVMIASTLPVVMSIRQLGKELRRERETAARDKREAELVAERNGAGKKAP